jgi:hypothetical protein
VGKVMPDRCLGVRLPFSCSMQDVQKKLLDALPSTQVASRAARSKIHHEK